MIIAFVENRSIVAWLALVGTVACGSSASPALFVDVKTDLHAGSHFATVRTDVRLASSSETLATQSWTPGADPDLVAGARVATITGLPPGEYAIDVALLDEVGDEVLSRSTRARVSGAFGLTVVLSRSCVRRSCDPGEACFAGACVDEGCHADALDLCPEPPQCRVDADCPAPDACSVGACVEGACFRVFSDDRGLSDGSGVPDDPFLLAEACQLDAVRDRPEAHFRLTADIDLAGYAFEPIPLLRGSVDGAGYAVRGLTIVDARRTALHLIRSVQGGRVSDLRLEDVRLEGHGEVAPLAGSVTDGGVLSNVHVTGDATIHHRVLAGVALRIESSGQILDASFDGVLRNTAERGPDAGYVGGVIESCDGTCRGLLSRGRIENAGWKSGGITHRVGGHLSRCASLMGVAGGSRVGGVVSILSGIVEDCYARGELSGTDLVGGTAAEIWMSTLDSRVTRTYFAGRLTGSAPRGIVGFGAVAVSDCAWDSETTGISEAGGGVGADARALTTAQMQDPSTFPTWSSPWVLEPGAYPSLGIE